MSSSFLRVTLDTASADKSTIAAPAANKTTATQPTQPLQQQQSATSDAAQPNPIGVVEGNGNVGDASSNGSEVRRRSAAPGFVSMAMNCAVLYVCVCALCTLLPPVFSSFNLLIYYCV